MKKIKFPESTFSFVQKFLIAMENDEKVISVSKEFYEDYILEADIVNYLLLNSLSFFSKKRIEIH